MLKLIIILKNLNGNFFKHLNSTFFKFYLMTRTTFLQLKIVKLSKMPFLQNGTALQGSGYGFETFWEMQTDPQPEINQYLGKLPPPPPQKKGEKFG
jgi:hypothetical protein